jgi:3-hydroxymyristoyl/3-hydroxydecanoyl-(acyl carrier protein) dehydratase
MNGEKMTAPDLMEMAQRLETKKIVLNQEQIKKIIPHREPFLFLDSVVEMTNNFIVAEKTITEKDCQGHFSPPDLVFPGHLALEALAQAATCLVLFHHPEFKEKGVALAKTKGKFRLPLFPGDKIKIKVQLKDNPDGFFFFSGEIFKRDFAVVEWEGAGKFF